MEEPNRKRAILKILTWLKESYWKWKVKRGIYVLEKLDEMMIKANYRRQERRQFWRKFIRKRANVFSAYKDLKKK